MGFEAHIKKENAKESGGKRERYKKEGARSSRKQTYILQRCLDNQLRYICIYLCIMYNIYEYKYATTQDRILSILLIPMPGHIMYTYMCMYLRVYI